MIIDVAGGGIELSLVKGAHSQRQVDITVADLGRVAMYHLDAYLYCHTDDYRGNRYVKQW